MSRRARLVAVVLACLAGSGPGTAQTEAPAAPSAAPAPMRILYLSRENDPAYQPAPEESGVFRPPPFEPSRGADLAIKDTRATAHAIGAAFELDKRVIPEGAPIEAEAKSLAATDAVAAILDLPLDDFLAVAKAAAPSMPLFNIRFADDALRAQFCGTGLFHVVPSSSMLTDALAQFTVQKNWRRALVLYGPLPADKTLADTFGRSAKKFGARIVAAKQFAYGNDPRKRDQIDVGLMSSSDDYDLVFLADTAGDFGRYVPFQLARPRPVIGTEGLEASAWDPLSERFGSPQVNHRFQRLAHRDMVAGDWAAWVAVRSVVEAAVRTKARDAASIEAALAHGDLQIDVSKGIQSSYRAWDHQLRQSIELHTGDAVIAYAPFEGFLHQRTPLDTLGTDEGESPCRPK